MKHLRFLLLVLAPAWTAHAAPSVDPELVTAFAAEPSSLQPVVITYTAQPDASDITTLGLSGLPGG